MKYKVFRCRIIYHIQHKNTSILQHKLLLKMNSHHDDSRRRQRGDENGEINACSTAPHNNAKTCAQCEHAKKNHHRPKCFGNNNHVWFGTRSCTVYVCSQNCNSGDKILSPVVVDMFNDVQQKIASLKEAGVPIHSMHISHTPFEHMHAWIHTHDPETSKLTEDKTRLETPLSDTDGFVAQGANPTHGTIFVEPTVINGKTTINYKDGGNDTVPYKTDQVVVVDRGKLAETIKPLFDPRMQQFYIFWYAATPDKITLAFPPQKDNPKISCAQI